MHRAFIAATLTAVIAALTLAAHAEPAGARQHGSPVAFLTTTVRLLAANRYAEAWQTLNPIDQDAAPLTSYLACESTTPIPGRLTALRVARVWNEPIRIAPETKAVPSVAVSFVLRLTGAGVTATVPLTAHAVRTTASWTWILPPTRLAMYRQNAC